jgi:putative peptidoglycan lipid II flippase
LTIVGVTLAFACAAIAWFAPNIVPIITPGFAGEKLQLTIQLTRIMALSPLLLGMSAVMGGVLQSTRRFFAFALAPILYNVGIIVGAVFLSPVFGIAGVAWGVVGGALLHLVAQASVTVPLGLRRLARPSFRPEGVRRILKLMIPRTAGLAVTQINLVILLALASSLETGAVAVFNLANNIQSFPVGVIGISFSIAAFPLLARAAGARDDQAFMQALVGAGRKIIFLILPMTALFLLLRAQIVRAILGQGKFDWDDTIRTAAVLGWFSFSLAAQSLVPLFARAFYAIQDTWTPLWISLASEITNIALALVLRSRFGIAGLAMAFSAAACVQFLLLAAWLCKRRRLFIPRELVVSLGKIFLATFALLAVAYPLRQWIGTVYPLRTFWQILLQAGASTIGGLAAFIGVSWALKSQEFAEFKSAIARRLWRKAKVTEGMDEAAKMG